MPVQTDVCTPANVPSQSIVRGQRDAHARRDYEVVVKHTTSVSARSSTCPIKKHRRSFTTELAKELSSRQHALEVDRVAAEVPMPVVAAHEIASDVVVPITVTPKTVSEAALCHF